MQTMDRAFQAAAALGITVCCASGDNGSSDGVPQTGYQVYVDGQSIPIGGTSAVAPLWAGLLALVNQKRGKAVGYLNPFLYQNYQQLASSQALRDIVADDNGAYKAGPAWDACTGLGTPDGSLLATGLVME